MILSLHGNYIQESDHVKAEAIVHDGSGNFHVGVVSSGSISLIHEVYSQVGVHDSFIATVNIEDKHRKQDGTVSVVFNHPLRSANLDVYGSVWVSSTLYTARSGVLMEPQTTYLPENPIPSLEQNVPPSGEVDTAVQQPPLDPVIVQVDFSEFNSVSEAHTAYSGGGYRLLPTDSQLVLQNQNELPTSLGAQCFVERGGQNFAPNATFSLQNQLSIPNGWYIDAPQAVATSRLINDISQAARTWGARFRDNKSKQQSNPVYVYSQAISFTPSGSDVTFSALCSILYGAKGSKVNNVDMLITFQNAGGVPLITKTKEFQAGALVGSYQMLYNTVKAADIPVGTAKVILSFKMYSVEQGDDVELLIFMPQFELGGAPTSRMVGIRLPDFYSIAADVPTKAGSVVVEHTFGYSGSPYSNSCLFSNLDSGNGIELIHLAVDGKMSFDTWDTGVKDSVVSSSAFDPAFGTHEFYATWDKTNSKRIIWLNDVKIAESLSPFTLSGSAISNTMFIGSNSAGSQSTGELQSFKVLRDFKGV